METDFRNAKVGDRVWDFTRGWGEVKRIYNLGSCPLSVQFKDGVTITYTTGGMLMSDDINPSLFWDEVKIVPPPKPKRKVKKTVEAWMVVNESGNCRILSWNCYPLELGKGEQRVKLTGEYEVEE